MLKCLNNSEWRRALGIDSELQIGGLILYGNWEYTRDLNGFCANREVVETRLSNVRIVKEDGTALVLAGAYGSPMAADITHMLCEIGCPVVIQTGFVGGLSPGLKSRDVVIATHALRLDGTSGQYHSQSEVVEASQDVVAALASASEACRIGARVGRICTTASLHAQTSQQVRTWSREGLIGVDMETAATFSVAHHYGIQCGAIFQVLENLLEGEHWTDFTKEAFLHLKERARKILEIALTIPSKVGPSLHFHERQERAK